MRPLWDAAIERRKEREAAENIAVERVRDAIGDDFIVAASATLLSRLSDLAAFIKLFDLEASTKLSDLGQSKSLDRAPARAGLFKLTRLLYNTDLDADAAQQCLPAVIKALAAAERENRALAAIQTASPVGSRELIYPLLDYIRRLRRKYIVITYRNPIRVQEGSDIDIEDLMQAAGDPLDPDEDSRRGDVDIEPPMPRDDSFVDEGKDPSRHRVRMGYKARKLPPSVRVGDRPDCVCVCGLYINPVGSEVWSAERNGDPEPCFACRSAVTRTDVDLDSTGSSPQFRDNRGRLTLVADGWGSVEYAARRALNPDRGYVYRDWLEYRSIENLAVADGRWGRAINLRLSNPGGVSPSKHAKIWRSTIRQPWHPRTATVRGHRTVSRPKLVGSSQSSWTDARGRLLEELRAVLDNGLTNGSNAASNYTLALADA
jgi:hypothetical protein